MVTLLSDYERRALLMLINDWEAENWLGQLCSKIPFWSLGLQQDWVRLSEFSYGNRERLESIILICQHGLMFRFSPLVF